MTNNRKIKYQGKIRTVYQLKAMSKGKNIVYFNSKDNQYKLKITYLKVTLCADNRTRLYSVIIHGFSEKVKNAMILLTLIN